MQEPPVICLPAYIFSSSIANLRGNDFLFLTEEWQSAQELSSLTAFWLFHLCCGFFLIRVWYFGSYERSVSEV